MVCRVERIYSMLHKLKNNAFRNIQKVRLENTQKPTVSLRNNPRNVQNALKDPTQNVLYT